MKDLKKLSLLFDSFHEAIYVVDKERKILYFNPVATQISGFEQNETEGFFCYDNILNHVDGTGKNLCFDGCPLVDSIKYNRIEDHMVYLHHKNGHRVKVHVRAIPYEEDGEIVGAIEVFTDETSRNLLLDELYIKDQLLMIDPLTKLFNRRFLDEKIENIIQKEKVKKVGILFFDIDDFKVINDKFGHLYGDDLLKAVSNTIQLNLKSTDYVIRFGGEEIVAILSDADEKLLLEIAEVLRLLIHQTKPRKPEHDYVLSVSIGATMLKNESVMEAIHRADLAMYDAKKAGKNNVVLKK
ncbi:MAG: sensor domain-containing diguanylate cyclase [Tenericutes bacterium]|nr:sensor domain-containing diguanylate cyclase [Mycoplasmatota bacterium]